MNNIEQKRLTREQASVLHERVRPVLVFLLRFKERLEETGFEPNGELYQVVDKAHDAIHGLHIFLHYESCLGGVGRPPKDK